MAVSITSSWAYSASFWAGAVIYSASGDLQGGTGTVVAKRMNKNQQMRWNRYMGQPFLTVRVHVLNSALEDAFRALHRDFRPPVPAYRHAAAMFLHLRGRLDNDRPEPRAAVRPDSDRAVLADLLARIDAELAR